MAPWLRKKKEEVKETPKTTSSCNCEICRFSNEVDGRIDAELRELVSPFIWLPSRVKNIDPEKALEEARKHESAGDISSALSSYNEAFVGALATEGVDITEYGRACIDFLGRHETTSTLYGGVENYQKLLGRSDVLTTLRKAYIDFIRAIPEPEKK